ncbi:TIGR03545 family protein [Petrachloros mirabilis]
MGKWIRWQGVVAFIVVSGLLACVWFLLVDTWVRRAIEKAGTAAVGAKVELDAADLSLMPLGLTLTRLQVTNPDEPMTNAVEIAKITGTLETLELLRRKVIVDAMTVDGMRFNTPRHTSGAIATAPKEKAAPSEGFGGFGLPSVQLNDPKEILAKELESLQSLKLAETLRAEVQGEKDKWQQQIASLPDKAKLNEYKQRIEKLKSAGKGGLGGVLGGVQEVTAIHDELRRDLDRITSVKSGLEQTLASLKTRAADVARLPQEDVKRLMEKYSVSGQGLANVTRVLFRGPLADYVQTAVQWHQRLEPFLSRPTEQKATTEVVKPLRGKGVDVRYVERAPLPEWLIRTARVSLEIPAGAISGEVKNITAEQHVLGAPLAFAFTGDKLKGLGAITLNGAINRVDRAKPQDTANLKLAAYQLDQLKLGGEQAPISLSQGLADLDVRATLRGPSLDAAIASKVRGVRIEAGKSLAPGPVGEAIAGALADVKAFQLKAEVTGTLDQFETKVESDLDEVLKDAVGKQAKAQVAKLESQLRAAIDEKVAPQLAEIKGKLTGFDPLIQDLAGRLNLGQDILKLDVGGFKLPF